MYRHLRTTYATLITSINTVFIAITQKWSRRKATTTTLVTPIITVISVIASRALVNTLPAVITRNIIRLTAHIACRRAKENGLSIGVLQDHIVILKHS